jgi:hypothetical protein
LIAGEQLLTNKQLFLSHVAYCSLAAAANHVVSVAAGHFFKLSAWLPGHSLWHSLLWVSALLYYLTFQH